LQQVSLNRSWKLFIYRQPELNMNKALIVSVLIGGMCGNIAEPMMPPVVAGNIPVAQIPPAVQVKLLTTGAEPRRELKFRPIANTKQTMTMTMGMSMDMMMGDSPMPKLPIPKMVMKMDLNVQQVDPSGDIHYNFAYSDIKVIADKDTPPEMLTAIQKSFKSLMGIKGEMIIGSSGQVKSKNLTLPKTVEPTMKQTLEQLNKSLDQISTRLPSEMVGLGAKWQVTNSLQVAGVRVNQSSTYEIVKLDDRGMTVQNKTIQSSPPQELILPGIDKQVKAKLTSLTSIGEGNYTIQFDSILPIEGKVSVLTDSKMTIQITPKEQPTNLVNKMAIELNISSK
jgi:hypothetical protein